MSSPINNHGMQGKHPIESTQHVNVSRKLSELAEITASVNDGKKLEENTQNIVLRLSNKELNLQGRVTIEAASKESRFVSNALKGFGAHLKDLPRQTSALVTNAA